MTNIPILGWYDQQNVGDEAFKDVFRAAVGRRSTDLQQYPFTRKGSNCRYRRKFNSGWRGRNPAYSISQQILRDVSVVPIGAGLGYESEIDLLAKVKVPFAVFRNTKRREAGSIEGDCCRIPARI